jgi:hypothetical protein
LKHIVRPILDELDTDFLGEHLPSDHESIVGRESFRDVVDADGDPSSHGEVEDPVRHQGGPSGRAAEVHALGIGLENRGCGLSERRPEAEQNVVVAGERPLDLKKRLVASARRRFES